MVARAVQCSHTGYKTFAASLLDKHYPKSLVWMRELKKEKEKKDNKNNSEYKFVQKW